MIINYLRASKLNKNSNINNKKNKGKLKVLPSDKVGIFFDIEYCSRAYIYEKEELVVNDKAYA
jgi:hypothetical protein